MKHNIMLIALIFCTQMSASSQIAKFASHKLGDIELYHDNGSFNVIHNNKFHAIGNESVDKSLRSINSKQLATFLKHGHISVTKAEDEKGKESFVVRGHVNGLGGGPVLGAITAVVGSVATGVATTAVFIVCLPSGPGAAVAAAATANAGMAATAYATVAATAAPTP